MYNWPHAQKAFKVTSMRIQFEDLIYLVANYEDWLTSCIDPKLSGNVTTNVNIILISESLRGCPQCYPKN